jgi:hypothetical protein
VSGVVEGGFGGDAAAEPSAFSAPPSPTAAGGFEPPS